MDVSLPQFYIGFKQRPAEGEAAFLRQQFELEILHELLIGSTSSCYEKLLRQEIITSSFGTEVFAGRGFLTSLFGGDSENPEAVWDALMAEIARVKREGIDEADFHACKNAIYGRMVRALRDVEDAATAFLSAEMSGLSFFDSVQMLAEITPADVARRLETDFDPDAAAMAVIRPRG